MRTAPRLSPCSRLLPVSVVLRTLRTASLALGVLAYGIGSVTAQQTLPPGVHAALAEAAAIGSQTLLAAVAAAIEENPGLARAIIDDAIRLDPNLSQQNVLAAIAVEDKVQTAETEESTSLGTGAVLAGAGAAVLVGGAIAFAVGGSGGSGGGSGGSPGPEPAPEPEPEPEPEPGPGPQPPDFETLEYKAQEGLLLVNASDAYARGATGKGVVIAVIDSGLDVSHPEFQGQIAPGGYDFVGNTPAMTDPYGHGTHVSGIAAAQKNDTGMHGVAYDAKILPIRVLDQTGTSPLTDAQFAAAIDRAINNGAMAVNNSWGSAVLVTDVTRDDILAQIPMETAAWGRAVDNGVVVVFATGNDFATQPSARSGLPYHFPEYQRLWLAVTAVELDGDDSTYGNDCGVAAAWCLAAPGGGITPGNPGVFSTLPVAQGAYGRMTGTSMAAPHVSGAVAVLMELFPELTPDEIVARLLETANKSGIYANSSIFGQGLLDLEAATRPVGEVVVLTGDSTAGSTYSLSATRVALGPAFGDGLKRSLRGAKLAVFDKDRATFVVDLDTFVRSDPSAADVGALLEKFQRKPQSVQLGPSSQLSLRLSDTADGAPQGAQEGNDAQLEALSFTSAQDDTEATVSYNQDPGMNFGLYYGGDIDRSLVMSEDAFSSPYLSLASEGYTFATSTKIANFGSLRVGAFLGQQTGDDRANGTSGGLGELAIPFTDVGEVSFQLGVVTEKDTVLGSRTEGAFDTSGTTTYFGGLTGKLALTGTLSVVGSYYTGLSNPAPAGGSLFSDISSIRSDAFSIGLVGEDAVSDDDRFGFLVNQPLRVTEGDATLSLATGRTRDGGVTKTKTKTDLAPSGRELDLEAFYERTLGDQSTLGVGTMLRMEPGHVAGAGEEAVVLLKFSHRF